MKVDCFEVSAHKSLISLTTDKYELRTNICIRFGRKNRKFARILRGHLTIPFSVSKSARNLLNVSKSAQNFFKCLEIGPKFFKCLEIAVMVDSYRVWFSPPRFACRRIFWPPGCRPCWPCPWLWFRSAPLASDRRTPWTASRCSCPTSGDSGKNAGKKWGGF